MRGILVSLLFLPVVLPATAERPDGQAVTFKRALALKADESVYAYGRVSPSGRFLVYTSTDRGIRRTIKVVELATSRVLFSEAGVDGYWAPDESGIIFVSHTDGETVAIWNRLDGTTFRNVAPVGLGDYLSWAVRDGRHIIMTVLGNYYYLAPAAADHGRVVSCPQIGTGVRPLISKSGGRISVFHRGTIIVRNINDCAGIDFTNVRGAKADFSWDDRYLAYHAPKSSAPGYEVQVVDLERRTMRRLNQLPGSSVFPSWTRAGHLCFLYDGPDFRGFITATNVLSAAPEPLPTGSDVRSQAVTWREVFGGVPRPTQGLNVVMIWASWNAHAPEALSELQKAAERLKRRRVDVSVATAVEPTSKLKDIARLLQITEIALPRLRLTQVGMGYTNAVNQIPTTLLFRDAVLVDQRLGVQAAADLYRWVDGFASRRDPARK